MLQDEAIEAGAAEIATRIAHAVHKNIELVGKYLGMFAQHHVSTKINLLVSEDYLRLRQAITVALRPHRDARIAVAQALQLIENDIAGRSMVEAGKVVPPPIIEATAS